MGNLVVVDRSIGRYEVVGSRDLGMGTCVLGCTVLVRKLRRGVQQGWDACAYAKFAGRLWNVRFRRAG
jgi:hypothetical protein